ncbi:hypothetical protein BDB01DRAFT_166317 [Pilobolus umbonatus]|nr:hypothetical protein BDB01DRAFT_166317 [Pilobolus umbonatus]
MDTQPGILEDNTPLCVDDLMGMNDLPFEKSNFNTLVNSSCSMYSQPSDLLTPNMIHRQRESTMNAHNKADINSNIQFSSEINCIQHIYYDIPSIMDVNTTDLDKLDTVLDANGILVIQYREYMNGFDPLEYPQWIYSILDTIMNKCGFTLCESEQEDLAHRKYEMANSFKTSPLSYILNKSSPHGVFKEMEITMKWATKNPREFHRIRSTDRMIKDYVEQTIWSLLAYKVIPKYKLIFSAVYVRKLCPIISYLPHISHSLCKIIRAAKETSTTEFNNSIETKLKRIADNTKIMHPMTYEDMNDESSIYNSMVSGLYYSVKNTTKGIIKQKGETPDALHSINNIWSVSCSSAEMSITE